MNDSKKYILSTRPLSGSIIAEAEAANVVIETLSFIETTPVKDEAVLQKIKELSGQKITVVFTSMNAVEAVADVVHDTPQWRIYCMGNTTQQLIKGHWGERVIAATAENAGRLGERLIDDGIKEAVFFCGNIRRDELPNKLRSEGGTVEEVAVYETTETPSVLTKEYAAILFFSPSAVEAFYKQNVPPDNTALYAIGKTTAEALRQHKAKKVVVGNVADKIELARLAIKDLGGF